MCVQLCAGVVKARQYGDSYLVLKDVRLRCTMCSTDSGGWEQKMHRLLQERMDHGFFMILPCILPYIHPYVVYIN